MEDRKTENWPNILTVRQFCDRFPAFTQGSIRWLIFRAEENGLGTALVRIGRRVLIDVDEFFWWIKNRAPKGSHHGIRAY